MKTLITLIAATCLVTAAFGQQPDPPSKPNPDYQKMAALLGEWTYAGEDLTTFLGPGGNFAGRMTGRLILEGLAREFTYREKKPQGETQSLEINWYDPVAKNHVYVLLSNDGYIEQGPFTINGSLATWEGTCVTGGKQYKTRGAETTAPDGMSKIQKTEISADGKMWTLWREARFTKVAATPAENASVEQELIKLKKDWAAAVVKRDLAFLDRILADDYAWTASDGNVWSKAETLASLKSRDDVVSSCVTDDFKVRVYGDTALVTARSTFKETLHGKDVSGQERFTDTWVKRVGRWQCVAMHCSKIAQRPSEPPGRKAEGSTPPVKKMTAFTQQPSQPTTPSAAQEELVQPPAFGIAPTPQIRPEAIHAHLAFLADDLLEGRGTGSRGHKLAVNYIRSQCEAFGLCGAADGGGYFQKVPLVRTIVEEKQTTLDLKTGDGTRSLVYGTDFVILDTHKETEGNATGELVFVGYGVTASEQGYDDYAGLDVKGKIVVMLSDEAPSSFPPAVRAYYTDHDAKRSNAAAHGAIGAIYVRSPATEKRFSWQFLLRELRIGFNSLRWLDTNGRPHGLDDTLRVFGTLNRSGAEVLFANEKYGLTEVFSAVEKGAPPRFTLAKSATVKFRSRHEKIESDNVVAVLEGSDPVLKNEYVLYSTHVDHLGIGDAVDGDSIYNGAMDNAGGCAVLLEVARSFGTLRERPRRSVIFLFVTGEEAGLLGSDYFASHPTIPMGQIVANINCDGGMSLTPLSDVIAWGAEHSSFEAAVQQAASQTGFTVSPDPFPEEGLFVRSDQFSFVKKGVPAIFVDVGVKSTQTGVDGLALLKQWLVTVYHSPKDDLTQPIQYATGVRFARFLFRLGYGIAIDPQRPQWNKNDFFGTKFGPGDR